MTDVHALIERIATIITEEGQALNPDDVTAYIEANSDAWDALGPGVTRDNLTVRCAVAEALIAHRHDLDPVDDEGSFASGVASLALSARMLASCAPEASLEAFTPETPDEAATAQFLQSLTQ